MHACVATPVPKDPEQYLLHCLTYVVPRIIDTNEAFSLDLPIIHRSMSQSFWKPRFLLLWYLRRDDTAVGKHAMATIDQDLTPDHQYVQRREAVRLEYLLNVNRSSKE